MATPEDDRRRAEPAGAFLPDAAAIERLANAFFKGVSGGAPLAPPAAPASAPGALGAAGAVHAGAGASRSGSAAVRRARSPATSVPASVPLRSFGGASAGSASPRADARLARGGFPRRAQTLRSRRPGSIRLAIGAAGARRTAAVAVCEPRSTCARALSARFSAALPGASAPAPRRSTPTRRRRAPAEADQSYYFCATKTRCARRRSARRRRCRARRRIAPASTKRARACDVYDAASFRDDFPILREKVHGRRLIWLDNGATTQKPQAVIDRLAYFYAHENSNVHRAAHTLAARATDAYEEAREKARRFLNAASAKEIVFVRGATEGINLVAQSWGRRNVQGRRRDRRHPAGAPRQYRALAAALRRDRREAARRAGRRSRRHPARRI